MNKLCGIVVAAIGALAPCLVGAAATDGVPARNTVHHSVSHRSRLILPVIARK